MFRCHWVVCDRLIGQTVFPFVKVLFQKRYAPPTTGPRPSTLANLTRHARLMDTNVIHDLPFGHMKTQADFVVEFHSGSFLMIK